MSRPLHDPCGGSHAIAQWQYQPINTHISTCRITDCPVHYLGSGWAGSMILCRHHQRHGVGPMKRISLAAVVGLAAATISQPAASQSAEQRLGKVHFDTSCKPQAQTLFDRAMLYQHSFWYSASRRTFEEVLKEDPQCAIAYWGIALSYLYNPHAPPPPESLPLGLEAVKSARCQDAARAGLHRCDRRNVRRL